ncbi:hypothetical protein PMI04_002770 [Sphingobium sp. AP49]|uniref:hypothetical protein n=1 Tax=Sphingobium sp. AP49 TaxID=1144307 RepID=UPI00026EE15E|nr:hypothetical protein [Sphingobium sp. AP49]WHO39540.1 hypothetical protein PMI04_002770 [Sphingobium sp. AP49]
MPISFFLGGSVAPILLMLSPFAVMAIGDCADWQPTIQSAKIAPKPTADAGCTAPRFPLM